MPTSIEDLFRLHARINSSAPSELPEDLARRATEKSQTPQASLESVLKQAVQAFLEKVSPESKTVEAFLKILAQVRDLKIANTPGNAKEELSTLGIDEFSKKTAGEIADLLMAITQVNAKEQISEAPSLHKLRQAVIESSLEKIRTVLGENIKTSENTQGQVNTTLKTAPLKLLEEILKTIAPHNISLSEPALREALTVHIRNIKSSDSEMRLDLLRASTHPLEPLKLMLESVIKTLEKGDYSKDTLALKEVLSTLLKDIKLFMQVNAPDSAIRDRLLEAKKSLEAFSNSESMPQSVIKVLPQIKGQIEILLSSKELSLSYGIDFASSSEDFKKIAVTLKESFRTLLQAMPKESERYSQIEKGLQLLTKLSSQGLSQDEVVNLKKLLPEIRESLSQAPSRTLDLRSAMLETTILGDIASSLPYEPLSAPLLKALTTSLAKVLDAEMLAKLATPNAQELKTVVATIRQELATLISAEAQGFAPQTVENPQKAIIQGILDQFLKLPVLSLSDETSPRSASYVAFEALLRNVAETRDVLMKLAGGPQEDSIRKIIDLMSQVQDGTVSIKEMKAKIEVLVEGLRSQPGDKTTPALKDLYKNSPTEILRQDFGALKAAEQLIQTGNFLRQINPLMDSLGQPAFILFPGLIRGIMTNSQVSLFTLPSQGEHQNKEGKDSLKDSHYKCAVIKVTLPRMGNVLVYTALKDQEIHISIGTTNSDVASFIGQHTFKLSMALRNLGYHVAQCTVETSLKVDGSPLWVRELVNRETSVA